MTTRRSFLTHCAALPMVGTLTAILGDGWPAEGPPTTAINLMDGLRHASRCGGGPWVRSGWPGGQVVACASWDRVLSDEEIAVLYDKGIDAVFDAVARKA